MIRPLARGVLLLYFFFFCSCFLVLTIRDRVIYREKIVAKVISAEACSEGAQGMLGVASTIKNRMDQRSLSAYEIVTQPDQYYGLTNPNRDKIFEDSRCSNPSKWLAKNINELPDIVDGAIFFRVINEIKQSWHKKLTTTIGRIEFYK